MYESYFYIGVLFHFYVGVLFTKYKVFFQETLKFDLNIAKLLQLLGDIVPQTPYWGFTPGPHWGTSIPQTH